MLDWFSHFIKVINWTKKFFLFIYIFTSLNTYPSFKLKHLLCLCIVLIFKFIIWTWFTDIFGKFKWILLIYITHWCPDWKISLTILYNTWRLATISRSTSLLFNLVVLFNYVWYFSHFFNFLQRNFELLRSWWERLRVLRGKNFRNFFLLINYLCKMRCFLCEAFILFWVFIIVEICTTMHRSPINLTNWRMLN